MTSELRLTGADWHYFGTGFVTLCCR